MSSAASVSTSATSAEPRSPEEHIAAIVAKWSNFACPPPAELTRSAAKLAQTQAVATQFLRLAQLALPHSADTAALMTLVDTIDGVDDCDHDSYQLSPKSGFMLANLLQPLQTLSRACCLDVPLADALSVLQELYLPLLSLLADEVEVECAEHVKAVIKSRNEPARWGPYLPLRILFTLIEDTCDATWVPKASSGTAGASAATASARTGPTAPSADRLARAEIGWQALRPHVAEVMQLVSAFLTTKSPMREGRKWMYTNGVTQGVVDRLCGLLRLPAMKQWMREAASAPETLAGQTVQALATQMLLWMEDSHMVDPVKEADYESQQSFLSRGLPLPPQWEGGPPSVILKDPRLPDDSEDLSQGWKFGPETLEFLLYVSVDAEVHSDALSELVWTHCSRTLQRAAAAASSSSTADPQATVSDLELRASMRGIQSVLIHRPRTLSTADVDAVDQWLQQTFAPPSKRSDLPVLFRTVDCLRGCIAAHRYNTAQRTKLDARADSKA